MIRVVRRAVRRLGGRSSESRLLERRLGHVFAEPELLRQALEHRSHINAQGGTHIDSNERLEFLGDAVLDLVITDYLYHHYPDRQEGTLSKIKSLVVSARVLAECARALELGRFLLLSKSEDRSGGRERESILADAFESVLGALYLDGGYVPACRLLHRVLVVRVDEFLDDARLVNYKSVLLEYAQSKGWGAPRYEVAATEGPEHGKRYTMQVLVKGEIWGEGAGSNKKEAEQAAARQALSSRQVPVPDEL